MSLTNSEWEHHTLEQLRYLELEHRRHDDALCGLALILRGYNG